MASEVDIVNVALGHLGDKANVSSISPPDQSAQAGHAARFYPMARDELQEMHPWGFCTRRAVLALDANDPPASWQFAYIGPAGVLNYLAVRDVNATDDWAGEVPMANTLNGVSFSARTSVYTPQAFVVETDALGQDVIYTNQQDAVLQYTTRITDTTKFSPLFTATLGYLLASKMAGPIIKGTEGRAVAGEMFKMAMSFLGRAATSDANQRRVAITQSVPWMANR
jgi:hypothetical protein